MFDPRTKLMGLVLCLATLFLLTSVGSLLIALGAAHLLFLLHPRARREIGILWKRLLPLLVFIMLLWPLFEPSQELLLWEWRFIRLGEDNLLSSLVMALRLMAVVFIFYYPLLTTGRSRLVSGLEKLGVPFSWAFTAVLAMESVPDFSDRWQKVRRAQQARGLDLDKGGFLIRARNLIPLLTAVIVSALRDSEQLTFSLINRGMDRTGERTSLSVLRFRWYDILVLLLLTSLPVWLIIIS